MHKIDKSETVINYISIVFAHFGTKRNSWNKAQAENQGKTKYITPTNTKARLHRDNATRRREAQAKAKADAQTRRADKASTNRTEKPKEQNKT